MADAIAVAKKCRPIIDPIGDFPLLLVRLRSVELAVAHGGGGGGSGSGSGSGSSCT